MNCLWITVVCVALVPVVVGNKTQRPQKDKIGECPANPDHYRTSCGKRSYDHECRRDSNCKGNDKCCLDGCIRRCVKPVNRCGPVCKIHCPFGNVMDSYGCPKCECNTGCRDNVKPLSYIECGRIKPKCPGTHGCVFPKGSNTGVCCPNGYY